MPPCHKTGRAFISVQAEDKDIACDLARRLRNRGFVIVATRGTRAALSAARIPADLVNKVLEGSPHVVDALREGSIHLVINTTHGAQAIRDSYSIRRNALQMGVPYFTTISAGVAAVDAMEASAILPPGVVPGVRSIQEWHARLAERSKPEEAPAPEPGFRAPRSTGRRHSLVSAPRPRDDGSPAANRARAKVALGVLRGAEVADGKTKLDTTLSTRNARTRGLQSSARGAVLQRSAAYLLDALIRALFVVTVALSLPIEDVIVTGASMGPETGLVLRRSSSPPCRWGYAWCSIFAVGLEPGQASAGSTSIHESGRPPDRVGEHFAQNPLARRRHPAALLCHWYISTMAASTGSFVAWGTWSLARSWCESRACENAKGRPP